MLFAVCWNDWEGCVTERVCVLRWRIYALYFQQQLILGAPRKCLRYHEANTFKNASCYPTYALELGPNE